MSDLLDTSHDAPLGEILGVFPLLAGGMMTAGAVTLRVGLRLPAHIHRVAAFTLIVTLLAVIGYVVSQRQHQRLGATVGMVLLSAAVVTTVFGVTVRAELRHSSTLATVATLRQPAAVVGDVVTEPRRVGQRWLTMVKTQTVDGLPVTERVAVLHRTEPPALGYGVSFHAVPRALDDSGFHRWLAQQHATVTFDVHAWTVDRSRQGLVTRASETLRARTRDAAGRYLSDANAGLMVALVTGDRRGITESDGTALRRAGMSHLTAVSGMHLGVFSAGVLAVLTLFRLSGTRRRAVLGGALVGFAFVTRFQPSVLRAGVMALILLYGSSRNQVSDARHALSVAVLLLMAVDPNLAGSVGLQLSAVATAGVLVIGPQVRRRLPAGMPKRMKDVMAVTGGAQLAVLPLLLGTFGAVPAAAFPANLLAALVAATAALIGFVAVAGAVMHPALGAVLFVVAAPLASVILLIARTFATWPQMGWSGTVAAGVAAVVVWRGKARQSRAPSAVGADR